jgi:hypothetical protein
MDGQQTKSELVQQIELRWAALAEVVKQLTPTQLTTPLDGDWTGKDLMAHITAWEQRLLELLQRGRAQPSGFTMEGVEDWDVDRLNEQYYEVNRVRPQTEVNRDFYQVHEQLMAELSLWPDDLTHPQWSSWHGGSPLWQIIPGDTYEHYDEHIGVLRRG